MKKHLQTIVKRKRETKIKPEIMTEVGEKKSIGDFLSSFTVSIPMLQRDYAQGRIDKGYIRKKFLAEVKNALENNGELVLDFIYGYQDENGIFFPLDGQQRLTTIWLVYWYIALRAKKLDEEKANLLRFSYETRKTSREFCKALCSNGYKQQEKLVDYIQNQTWFFEEWKNDPSISSMLRTIGGSNDGNDGIEPVFKDMKTNANGWGTILQHFKNSISFYVLNIGDEKLPRRNAEQLYVKMNARGKSLTDFENFKADFISHLHNSTEFKDKQLNGNAFSFETAKKIDNDWNDVFWKSVSAEMIDGKTDEVFFSFINRFCFNCLSLIVDVSILNNTADIDSIIEQLEEIDAENEKDKYINLKKYQFFANEKELSYEDFSLYEEVLNYENVQSLDLILKNYKNNCDEIDNTIQEINKIVSQREKTEYTFIPKYALDEKNNKLYCLDKGGNKTSVIKELTLKNRVYFYVICQYLKNKSFDNEKFNDWIRFCRNIIENYGVDSENQMVSCIKALSEFNSDSQDINSALCSKKIPDGKTKYNLQLKEEIEKAKIRKKQGTAVNFSESDIIGAEDYSIFCGHIRCLFINEKGQEDWKNFKNKSQNMKSIVTKDGIFDFGKAKAYACSFKDFEDVKEKMIFHQKGWQNRGDNWLEMLDSDPERTHKLLMNKLLPIAEGDYQSFINSNTYEIIVKKKTPMVGESNLRISEHHGVWALYKKNSQEGKLYFNKRGKTIKSITTQNNGVVINKEHVIDENEFYYWGENINFMYCGEHFVWTADDNIYEFPKKEVIKCSKASGKKVNEILSDLKK